MMYPSSLVDKYRHISSIWNRMIIASKIRIPIRSIDTSYRNTSYQFLGVLPCFEIWLSCIAI